MRLHRWKDVRDEKLPPEKQAASDRWVKQNILKMNLPELQEQRGKLQAELAALIEMNQGG